MMKDEKPKSVEFKIESILAEQRLVFARRLDGRGFNLGPQSYLGSRLVEHFDMPRNVRNDGSIDTGLFCFRLADRLDPGEFRDGAVVFFHE